MEENLFKNEHIDIYKKDGWYTFYRHPGTNQAVCILPYRRAKNENPGPNIVVEYLVREENIPVFGGMSFTSVTGGVEEGETESECALRELMEETGFLVKEDDLEYWGRSYRSKMSDSVTHLYTVDVTDLEQGEIKGDGSKGEEGASVHWLTDDDIVTMDTAPLLSLILMRVLLSQAPRGEDADVYEEFNHYEGDMPGLY